jgi:hypothetical protein
MDKLGLLADSQHGFSERRSTETQLILSIGDLAKGLDVGEQMDCILLDFSKAFDKAPHSRLRSKRGPKTMTWGTPEETVVAADDWPSSTTHCVRPSGRLVIQSWR